MKHKKQQTANSKHLLFLICFLFIGINAVNAQRLINIQNNASCDIQIRLVYNSGPPGSFYTQVSMIVAAGTSDTMCWGIIAMPDVVVFEEPGLAPCIIHQLYPNGSSGSSGSCPATCPCNCFTLSNVYMISAWATFGPSTCPTAIPATGWLDVTIN